MLIPTPNEMTLESWADAVVQACVQYSNINPFTGDWQAWGMCFLMSPQIGNLLPPNPYQYDDWREWGYLLAQALLNAKGAPRQQAA